MDYKTFASVTDLATEFGISKTKIFFLQKLGFVEAQYVISNKILVFDRKKAETELKAIFKLQAQGMSLRDIKIKLCEKNNLRKNDLS